MEMFGDIVTSESGSGMFVGYDFICHFLFLPLSMKPKEIYQDLPVEVLFFSKTYQFIDILMYKSQNICSQI